MDLMNTKPADLKAEIESRKTDRQTSKIEAKPVYTPAEKAAVSNAQTATFFAAQLTGADPETATSAATAVRAAAQGEARGESVNALMEALPGDGQIVDVASSLSKTQQGQVKREDAARTTSFSNQVGAAFSEMTALPALLRMIERPSTTVDPTFDYMAVRDVAEANRPEEDRQWLRESESQADLTQKLKELADKDARYAKIGAHGQTMAVAASLTGGLVDPVGLAAGLGVGKVAQLAGIGARVAAANGQIGRAVAYGAIEGATGNVLTEAALDAAGGHVTASDYVTSAAFGAVFGQLALLGARGARRADAPADHIDSPDFVGPRTPKEAGEDMMARAQEQNMDLYSQAQARAGENATPEDIRTEADNIIREQADSVQRTAFADVPEQDRFMPLFDLSITETPAPRPPLDLALSPSGTDAAGRQEYSYSEPSTGGMSAQINAVDTGDDLRIIWATNGHMGGVRPEGESGAGQVTSMYREVLNDAAQMGKRFTSDDSVSAAAQRVWQRLHAEGVPVETSPHVQLHANGELKSTDGGPVYFVAAPDVPEPTISIPKIDEVMRPAAERLAVSERWGINMNTVEDGTERKMLGELAARAEGWDRANPVDPERINSILGRVPWLASSGLQLARSENPVARMIAGTLLESTTGATGRRRTAAITKTMRERVYMEDLVGYEEAYKQWRRANGGTAYRDVLGSDHRSRFDRLVGNDREARRLGMATSNDVHIRAAGDQLDKGYAKMSDDQVNAGTIGSERLKGLSSVGYVHRTLSPKWVMNATNEEINALSNKLAEQLQIGWDDVQFARQIATRYVERARTTAYGGTSVPANLASPEAASVLRDVLRSMSVGTDDIERAMGRFSRGGASHTKGRLDLDLSENIDLPNGSSFPMMNAFETDQASMYMQYARRVSGDVALTQYGVMGDQGMKVLRKAMEYGPNGKRASASEMEAFDQIAAEFYGRPMEGTGNKHLGNLRMLTAASRLGGMAFTQFAEMANAVSLLGVGGALKHVGSMPGLIADVAKGKSSPLLESIERIGGPLGQDHRVVFPYQEPNDVKVYGRDSLNAFDRIVRAGSNAMPWLSGWHMVHSAQVRGISEQIIHKSFRYIREGGEEAALRSMGMTDDLIARLRADLPNIATFNDDGSLASLNLLNTADHGAAAEFVQAVHRGGKQIIQGTYIGETGKWAHNDLMRMLVQFRSFSLTSMEKQWTRQRADVGTAKAFGLLMGQMSFALPIHLSRVAINSTGREDKQEYLETQLHPAMLARAVLNYTSLSGMAGDILDAGASIGGWEASGVRTGNSSVLGNVPSLGYIDSAAKAVKQRDAREAIRMLPGGNLPYLTPVVNSLTE